MNTATEQFDQWQQATLKRLLRGGFRMYAPGETLKSLETLGLVSLTRLSSRMSLTAVELTERGCEVATQLAERGP